MRNTLFSILMLLYAGCIKYQPTDDYTIEGSQVELAIPLFSTDMTIPDLVAANDAADQLTIHPDGTMVLIYQGNVIKRTAAEIFPPIPGFLGIPIPDTIFQVPLPFTGGDEISKAIVGSTNMKFSFADATYPKPILINVEFPHFSKNGEVLNLQFIMDTPTMTGENISLEGYEFTPDGPNISMRYTAVDALGKHIKLESVILNFDVFTFQYVEGKFAPRTFDIQGDVITVGLLDHWSGGGVSFTDPSLILTVDNKFGLPTLSRKNQLDIITTDGEILSLESDLLDNGIHFDYPVLSEVGQTKTTQIILDKNNSNIDELFSSRAALIAYDIDALVNTENPGEIGFITNDGFFDIGVEVRLPLQGKANNLRLETETEINLEEIKEVKSADLKISAVNQFPIAIGMQGYFYLGEEALDSLFSEGQQWIPSQSENDGNYIMEETFDSLRVEKFIRADRLILQGTFLSIPNNAAVTLLNTSRLSIKAGAIIRLK